uniref:BRCA1-associated ATM activator 1 n=1 Tax=Oryzias latipes TaxID=8090 RepID=A0A3P9M847_ORYLA
MDGDCVSLLPRVCDILAAPRSSLPDDTSLEKLLDWFTTFSKSGVSLLEVNPCLQGFISTVVSSRAAESSIISFALKLTGLVAAAEDGFRALQASSVLDLAFNPQHWREDGLWDDPCVRIGWIQGFSTMLQHRQAFSFFVQADSIKPLLQLQTDTSLFVASAAGQMLAHVLMLSHPLLSGFNGKEVDDKSSSSSITGSMRPAVIEADQDVAAVVTEILEYLKTRMLPKESSQLHQSQQILKLLALILSQAGPSLRDKLLLFVRESLEELVASNYSQLTRPLMDVILAAYSSIRGDEKVPDPILCHLLSVMLNQREPFDRIHAAAAFLCSGHDNQIHMAQSACILLLPMEIITGLTLLEGNSTVKEHRLLMMEQLQSKISCISMICISLKHIPKITHMAPDCRPCPPAVVVAAVLALLRLCRGLSPPSLNGCVAVFRNVTGSGKVQKCALEALSALSSSSEVSVMLVEVFTLLIEYLNHPDSDPTMLQKSYQALVQWIGVCSNLSSITNQLKEDLTQVVRKRACDMRWEVRDSTVEFLGHLAGLPTCRTEVGGACNAAEYLLGGCCVTTPLLVEALHDPESYVRASAVSALAQTMTHSWQEGVVPTKEQAEIVTQLLEMLSQDTEGFARRAVLQYFISWFSSHPSCTSSPLLMQSVRSVLLQGSADLDWEVKVHTLDLAELLMDQAFLGQHGYTKGLESHPAQPHPYAATAKQAYTLTQRSDLLHALDGLVKQGLLSVLLSGLFDCDRPVGLKACRLLIRLKHVLLLKTQDESDAVKTDPGLYCELLSQGWAQEIRNVLGTEDRSNETDPHTVTVNVCNLVTSLDLEDRLDVLTRSSDHFYNSPRSLLQDILTASAAHAQQDSQLKEEVIVDCY